MDRGRERTVAKDMIKRLAVKTPSERSSRSGPCPVATRRRSYWPANSSNGPKLLVLAEPTQGVDVGAKEEIHRSSPSWPTRGTAVLVVTSDLPEALRISDRLQVVRVRDHDCRVRPGRHPGGRAGRRGPRLPIRPERSDDHATPEHRPEGGVQHAADIRPRPRRADAPPEDSVSGCCRRRSPVRRSCWSAFGGVVGDPRFATPAFLTSGSIQPLLGAVGPDRRDRHRHDDRHHHRRDRRLGRRDLSWSVR